MTGFVQGRRMRILYLYTEVMGYTLATIRELVAGGADVHLVHWDRRKLTPFQVEAFEGLQLYKRSELSDDAVMGLARELSPHLLVVSGWQDRGYLPTSRMLRRRGVPVAAGFDDQWHGTVRQRVAAWGGAVLRLHFSHAWVAGPLQYDYARRMGFGAGSIIHDLYSADVRKFRSEGPNSGAPRKRRFVFVGRLEKVKGIDLLLEAWVRARTDLSDWELLLIGNGSFESALAGIGGVRRRKFLSAAEINDELALASAFVLPSRHEPWGVALHEAVASGLPVLCSDVVGAASTFVIDGYNGHLFRSGDATDLARAMRLFAAGSQIHHGVMSERSLELSRRITPASSAANLLSLLSRPSGGGRALPT